MCGLSILGLHTQAFHIVLVMMGFDISLFEISSTFTYLIKYAQLFPFHASHTFIFTSKAQQDY